MFHEASVQLMDTSRGHYKKGSFSGSGDHERHKSGGGGVARGGVGWFESHKLHLPNEGEHDPPPPSSE